MTIGDLLNKAGLFQLKKTMGPKKKIDTNDVGATPERASKRRRIMNKKYGDDFEVDTPKSVILQKSIDKPQTTKSKTPKVTKNEIMSSPRTSKRTPAVPSKYKLSKCSVKLEVVPNDHGTSSVSSPSAINKSPEKQKKTTQKCSTLKVADEEDNVEFGAATVPISNQMAIFVLQRESLVQPEFEKTKSKMEKITDDKYVLKGDLENLISLRNSLKKIYDSEHPMSPKATPTSNSKTTPDKKDPKSNAQSAKSNSQSTQLNSSSKVNAKSKGSSVSETPAKQLNTSKNFENVLEYISFEKPFTCAKCGRICRGTKDLNAHTNMCKGFIKGSPVDISIQSTTKGSPESKIVKSTPNSTISSIEESDFSEPGTSRDTQREGKEDDWIEDDTYVGDNSDLDPDYSPKGDREKPDEDDPEFELDDISSEKADGEDVTRYDLKTSAPMVTTTPKATSILKVTTPPKVTEKKTPTKQTVTVVPEPRKDVRTPVIALPSTKKTCPHCKETFSWNPNFEKHVRNCREAKEQLKLWDEEIQAFLAEGNHLKMLHQPAKNASCINCNFHGSKNGLDKHIQRFHGHKEYQCRLCNDDNISYYCLSDILDHARSVHFNGKNGNPKASVLDKTDHSEIITSTIIHNSHLSVVESIVSDDGTIFFVCRECDFNGTRVQFGKHIREAHEGKSFKCNLCNGIFSTKPETQSHVSSTHFSKNENSSSQTIDFEAYIKVVQTPKRTKVRNKGERRSFKTIQNNITTHKCSQCNFKSDFEGVFDHIATYHATRPYECNICSKTFKRFHLLKDHRDTHYDKSGKLKLSCYTPGRMDDNELHTAVFRDKVCEECGQVVKGQIALDKHKEEECGRTCKHCGVLVKHRVTLEEHKHECGKPIIIKPEAQEIQYCLLCGDDVESTKLREHFDICPNRKTYTCKFCIREYDSVVRLANHLMKVHNVDPEDTNQVEVVDNEKPIQHNGELEKEVDGDEEAEKPVIEILPHQKDESAQDPIDQALVLGSGTKEVSKELLFLNTQKHSEFQSYFKRYYVCEECDTYFKHKDERTKHIEANHPEINVNKVKHVAFVCTVADCEFVTYERIKIIQHVALLHMEKILPCKQCNKLFALPNDLQTHIQRVHNAVYEANCPDCGKYFKDKRYMEAHRKRVHDKELKHVCEICNKGFFDKQRYLQHREIHMDKEERVKIICPDCGKQFLSKTFYKDHVNIHKGLRPYVCKICCMDFTCRATFHRHQRIHWTHKPHVCDVCGKGFREKFRLEYHKTIHTGKSKHICEGCNKAFTVPGSLKTHRKTCAYLNTDGAQPRPRKYKRRVENKPEGQEDEAYMCSICNMVFPEWPQIVAHLEMHNAENQTGVVQAQPTTTTTDDTPTLTTTQDEGITTIAVANPDGSVTQQIIQFATEAVDSGSQDQGETATQIYQIDTPGVVKSEEGEITTFTLDAINQEIASGVVEMEGTQTFVQIPEGIIQPVQTIAQVQPVSEPADPDAQLGHLNTIVDTSEIKYVHIGGGNSCIVDISNLGLKPEEVEPLIQQINSSGMLGVDGAKTEVEDGIVQAEDGTVMQVVEQVYE